MTSQIERLEQETLERLYSLDEWESQRDLMCLDKNKALEDLVLKRKQDIMAALPQELRAKIAEIEQAYEDADVKTAAEFDNRLQFLEQSISGLSERIKEDVLKIGYTVKGEFKQAVWNRGRITWNSKGLQGYQVAHPEIATFREDHDPTVTIRSVKRR